MKQNPESTPLEDRIDDLRADLIGVDVYKLAALTGSIYEFTEGENGQFKLSMWDNKITVSAQDFTARDLRTRKPLDLLSQAFVAYYFHNAKPYVSEMGWVSFTQIPEGKFYNSAHKEQTSKKLLEFFGNDYHAFETAAEKAGGKPVTFDTVAYKFQVFPKVALMVALWKGDEDFPPSYRILFNRDAVYHLNAEAYAILGSVLTGKIIKAK